MDPLSVLQQLGTHRFIEELGATLAEVSDQVVSTRKKGKVTVSFVIAPTLGDEAGVTVSEEIKRTPPVKDSRGAYFFAVGGELFDRDPRRPELPMFREVDTVTGEVRETDDPGTTVREA